MLCKKCKTDNAIIEQEPDGHRRQVRCLACGYIEPLKNYNKKANN